MANSGTGKIFKWIVGIVAAILVFGSGWLHLRLSEFQELTRELKEDGYPVAMSDLRHIPKEGKTDALPLILQALPLMKKFGEDLHEIEMKHHESAGSCTSPAFFANSSEEKLVELKELLERHGELTRLIDELFLSEDVTVNVTPVLNGNTKSSDDELGWLAIHFVSLGSFTRVRSHVLNQNGEGKLAFENGLKSIEFAKILAHRNDGWFTNQHAFHIASCGMQSVYEAMSSLDPTKTDFDRINRATEEFGFQKTVGRAVAADRATAIEHITDAGIQHAAINGVAMLEFYDAKEIEMQKELFEYDYEPSVYTVWNDGPWLFNMGANFDRIYVSERAESYAKLRGLRIVSALLQHEVSPEGFEAIEDKQAALVKLGVPEEMTRDTCTGETMKIKFEDGMWKVWSVGLDKVDDGGTLGTDAGLAWKNGHKGP